jgi:hypothetical protein
MSIFSKVVYKSDGMGADRMDHDFKAMCPKIDGEYAEKGLG